MFGLELLPGIHQNTATTGRDVTRLISLFRQSYLDLNQKLDLILANLKIVQSGEVAMTQELQSLTEEVARNTAVDQSAIALLTGLSAKIEALKDDPVALQALANDMRSSSDALAQAVLANTPAAPST